MFAVKASRYLTHMKRLTDLEPAHRSASTTRSRRWPSRGKLGPVLWQFPANFHRDEDRLADALAILPAGPPLLRVPPRVLVHRPTCSSCCAPTTPRSPTATTPSARSSPLELTADWTFLRFHYGRRGRRGNYSETELREWADRGCATCAPRAEVYAYFNNDWEGFAVRPTRRRLQALLGDT